MKGQSDLDAWRPALSQSMRELAPAGGGRTVLKILELCAGCKSVSTAAAKEARETFGIQDVQVFSLDGKPGTNCTRCVDILTYDWARDRELRSFREEREEGVRYIYYADASPPCGPYSSMANHCRGWGDSVAQRCMELIGYFDLTSGPSRAEARPDWIPGCSCERSSRCAAPLTSVVTAGTDGRLPPSGPTCRAGCRGASVDWRSAASSSARTGSTWIGSRS